VRSLREQGSPPSPPFVQRALLVETGVLFVAALLVAVAAAALALPLLTSTLAAALFVALLVLADLAVLFLFLHSRLERSVFGPLGRIGEGAERVAAGELELRIPEVEGEELARLVRSVHAMADRLLRNQEELARNIYSLDVVNRELIEATEEMVRSARLASIGTLASGIAHEVGNPLAALIANLEVIRGRMERGGDLRPPLEGATEEAFRIDRIVRGTLALARDGAPGSVEPIPIVAAVEATLALLEERGVLAGISLQREFGDGAGVLILGGRQLLEQLLTNLLMNAAWAVRSESSPTIGIRLGVEPSVTPPLPPRRASDPPGLDYSHRRRRERLAGGDLAPRPLLPALGWGEDLLLEVWDNGPGVPPAVREGVFDPFFTTKAPGEGTGLGLAIAQRIAAGMGGGISIQDSRGGGASFLLRLPATREATV